MGSRTTAKAHLMCSEAFCRRVILPALAAAEGFLLCVAELVFLQVADLEELLPAAGAPVPPLSDLRLPLSSAGCGGNCRACRGCGGLRGDQAPLCWFHWVWVRSAFDPVDASRFSSQAGAAAKSRRCRADLSDLSRCFTCTVCLTTCDVHLTCCCLRCSLGSSFSTFLCAPLLRVCAGLTPLEAFSLLSAQAFLSSSSPL